MLISMVELISNLSFQIFDLANPTDGMWNLSKYNYNDYFLQSRIKAIWAPLPEMKSGAPFNKFSKKTDSFKMSQFAAMSITTATSIFETNFILFCFIFISLCHVESLVIITEWRAQPKCCNGIWLVGGLEAKPPAAGDIGSLGTPPQRWTIFTIFQWN